MVIKHIPMMISDNYIIGRKTVVSAWVVGLLFLTAYTQIRLPLPVN